MYHFSNNQAQGMAFRVGRACARADSLRQTPASGALSTMIHRNRPPVSDMEVDPQAKLAAVERVDESFDVGDSCYDTENPYRYGSTAGSHTRVYGEATGNNACRGQAQRGKLA